MTVIGANSNPPIEVPDRQPTSPHSIYEWAARIGSRARTRYGAIRAIMAHIRDTRPTRGASPARGHLETDQWLPELRALGLERIPEAKPYALRIAERIYMEYRRNDGHTA